VREGGSIFFMDGRPNPTSTATDQVLPEAGSQLSTRILDDGRTFQIVKNFWPSEQLEQRFAHASPKRGSTSSFARRRRTFNTAWVSVDSDASDSYHWRVTTRA
jgi:hypothetical protein